MKTEINRVIKQYTNAYNIKGKLVRDRAPDAMNNIRRNRGLRASTHHTNKVGREVCSAKVGVCLTTLLELILLITETSACRVQINRFFNK